MDAAALLAQFGGMVRLVVDRGVHNEVVGVDASGHTALVMDVFIGLDGPPDGRGFDNTRSHDLTTSDPYEWALSRGLGDRRQPLSERRAPSRIRRATSGRTGMWLRTPF